MNFEMLLKRHSALGLISHTLVGRSGVFLCSRLGRQCRPGRINQSPSSCPAHPKCLLLFALCWMLPSSGESHVRASGCLSRRPDPLDAQLWRSQAQGKLELVALSARSVLCPVLLACTCWPLPLCGLLSWWALLPLGSCTCLSCVCFLWSIGLGMTPEYSWLGLCSSVL